MSRPDPFITSDRYDEELFVAPAFSIRTPQQREAQQLLNAARAVRQMARGRFELRYGSNSNLDLYGQNLLREMRDIVNRMTASSQAAPPPAQPTATTLEELTAHVGDIPEFLTKPRAPAKRVGLFGREPGSAKQFVKPATSESFGLFAKTDKPLPTKKEMINASKEVAELALMVSAAASYFTILAPLKWIATNVLGIKIETVKSEPEHVIEAERALTVDEPVVPEQPAGRVANNDIRMRAG
ncbi:MAG TPA: hypothetical protein VFR09_02495 [Alphaproteobacteria bacterium]|nr:hypothetical protein [Alphaproteobacteria bacterium]